MIDEKGLGGKKVNRVGISLTNHYDGKLRKLATACNMKPTPLAGLIVEMCLDDPVFVAKLQKEYCTQSSYRVIPISNGKKIEFVLGGREDL